MQELVPNPGKLHKKQKFSYESILNEIQLNWIGEVAGEDDDEIESDAEDRFRTPTQNGVSLSCLFT